MNLNFTSHKFGVFYNITDAGKVEDVNGKARELDDLVVGQTYERCSWGNLALNGPEINETESTPAAIEAFEKHLADNGIEYKKHQTNPSAMWA